jgi:DNA-binding protein HU-beta
MNKTELIAAIAAKSDLTKKDAEKALSAFESTVTEALVAGNKVQLVGFGTFDVAERAERDGRNPQTGAKMKIAASKAPRFKVGKKLRDAVNK